MASKNKKTTTSYQTYPGNKPAAFVPTSSLLPGVHRTTRNNKYIDALLGELTSKGTLESFDGYIGSANGKLRRKQDIYLANDNRYCMGVSADSLVGDIVDIREELTVRENIPLKDAKQLTGKSYGFDPHIDPDKFINYQNYYWLPFDLPTIALEAGLDETGEPAIVNIGTNIIGQAYYVTNTQANGRRLTLRNGMKVYFIQRELGVWEESESYLTIPSDSVDPKYYIVSGVGSSIKFLPFDLYANPLSLISVLAPLPWDNKNWDRNRWDTDVLTPGGKQYVTIASGSSNYNVWSRTNRWTHEQTALETARFLDIADGDILKIEDRAARPIVEFYPNIDLWNHGNLGKTHVTLLTDSVSSLNDINGIVNPVIDGVSLPEGARIIFVGGDPAIKNKTFVATGVDVGVLFVPASDSNPTAGQSVLILDGPHLGQTYWYNGSDWIKAQQLSTRGQAPLFRLFDGEGIPIENYDVAAFSGSQIFGYSTGPTYDRELNLSIAYDSSYKNSLSNNIGAISFTNYIATTYQRSDGITVSQLKDITSFNYFREWNIDNAIMDPIWTYSSGWKPISECFSVKKEYSFNAEQDGDFSLVGSQWVHDPSYTWNISMPAIQGLDEHKDFLIEEVSSAMPAREWYDTLIFSKIKDGKIYNYTGRRLQIANQRGIVFIDTFDVEVDLPASLFDAKTTYLPTDCRPGDYIIKWKIGEQNWTVAKVIGRRRDDIRRPSVLVNGQLKDTSEWRIIYAGGPDEYTTPVLGLRVLGLKAKDTVDIVVNGSMITSVNRNADISNLSNNPYNEIVSRGAYGQFFDHFRSAIAKNIMPRFLDDTYHQGTQHPRFDQVEGYNSSFGDNDWAFTMPAGSPGNNILLHDSPANRYFWVMRSAETGSVFPLMEDARKAYSNFKLKFIQKIERLYLDQDISNVQAAVDKALSDIFVGRNESFRYAHSHMVMWGTPDAEKIYTFADSTAQLEIDGDDADPTVVDVVDGDDADPTPPIIILNGGLAASFVDYECEIPSTAELGEISTDHVYVYYKNYNDTAWRILTYTKDYDIDQTAKTVHISAEFDTPCQFKICVFKKTRVSYVPPTPAKLGITPWYHPEYYTDTTYQGSDVLFIQGHDGSLTPAWGDFRDDMLLEFERRVASSIGKERGERAELLFTKHWPRKMRQTWYNRTELNSYLEDAWLTWANENNIVETPNLSHVINRPLTYNYSAFEAVDGNTYGSWRDIYRHVYGTDRPDTHPWEMLGFARKPSNWDSMYSWTDLVKRDNLIRALTIGNRSNEPFPAVDTNSFIKHDVEYLSGPDAPFLPVDENGNLRNPLTAGWYDATVVNASQDTINDWTFGNIGAQELAWRRSSEFAFSCANWLLLAGGPEYLESVWEGPKSVVSSLDNAINVDRTKLKIVPWATANQHRETGADIVPGYGMLINELAASLSPQKLADVVNETRNIKTRLQWTANGFLEANSLDFVADILIEQEKGNRIPQEDYAISLKTTSPSLVLTYSGVKVIVDSTGGYKIQGFDNISTFFPYYSVKIAGPSIPVEVGSITYKKYTAFETTISYLDYGTVLMTRQEVINFLLGYGQYLESQGWKFEDTAPTQDDILDWSYSAREFVTWSQTRWQENTQISLSPAAQNLVLSHDTRFFGRLDTTFLSRTYLLDDNGRRIDFKDTEVVREQEQTTIKSRPGIGIYFVRCGLEEYTHTVVFKDVTIFNDQINDYLFGLSIRRLRAQGKRTSNWDGRPLGFGYLVRESTVEQNLDTISREIGDDYITIENRSSNPWIRNLKKNQLGISRPDDTLLAAGFSKDTADQFQAGSLRRKGTPNIIEKFTKGVLGDQTSSDLAVAPGITVRENWMFRMGEDIGNVGTKSVWEIKIPSETRETLLDQVTLRVIPPFVENTYYEATSDRAADNIIDLLGPKDRRWVKYPRNFELPLRTKSVQVTDLPQAGIADRIETDYKFMDIDQLYDIDISDDILGEMSAVNTWSTKLPYDEGDLVRYKGQLYKANYSQLAQSLFDPDAWTAIEELRLPSIWLANKTPESNDVRDWTVLQTMDRGLAIRELCAGTFEDPYHPLVEMETGVKHNVSVNDWVLILSTERSGLNGYYKVSSIRDTESFFIELKFNPFDFVVPDFPPGNTSAGGKLFVVKHTHFYTVEEMNASILDSSYEWNNGMMAYVDDRINRPLVYSYRGNYSLFRNNGFYDNRGLAFYDLQDDNFLHQWEANNEENMPWLFAIGVLLAAFKQLDAGTLELTDSCAVSLAALGAPGPNVLPNTVASITVQDALNGIIFRQFNDCAWVLAEKMYTSVTAAAAAINTIFVEDCIAFVAAVEPTTVGSGTTTDLAKIAKTIWSYVDYQYLFAQQTWFFRGKIYANNNVLIDYNGIGLIALQNPVEDANGDFLLDEFHMIGIKSYASRELMMVALGYSSRTKRNADAIALLDTVESFGSGSGTFNQIPFVFDRALGDIVDHSRITKVEIVDYENNRVLATLNPYDPAAGILPAYVDSFIDWKQHDDPASYTESDLEDQEGYSVRPRFAWFDEHQGQVWWDLSAVRYYDYYQGSVREKAFQWGKQFPGSTVQIYEWVKSVVPPAQWVESARTGFLVDFESVTGTPYNKMINGEPKYFWSEREEKDKNGVIRTFYYFWVAGMDRTYSSKTSIQSVAAKAPGSSSAQVYTRATAGIPSTANKFNVTQIASVVGNPKVSGAMWFAGLQKNAILLSGVGKLLGQKGAVLRIEVDNDTDAHDQWLLMKENDITSTVSDWLHIRMRDSIIGSDQTETIYSVSEYQQGVAYARGSVVRKNNNYYRAFRDFLGTDVAFGDSSPVSFVSQPWQRIWDFRQIEANKISEIQGKSVPDYNRHKYDRYGNEIRPTQQSWLNDRIEAIRIFVNAANRELAKVNVTSIIGWDDRLNKIIATNDPNFSYDVSLYWDYVDFVDSTFDPARVPVATLTSGTELYNYVASPGDYVKVLTGDEEIVNIWEKIGDGWSIVFQQNGTIQLSKRLFDLAKQQDLWDAVPWDSLRWDQYPFVELFEIITALREDVFVDSYQVHYNVVFFALAKEVLRQNPTCHWIRKSSYIDVERVSIDALTATPYFRKEYLRNDDGVLTDFINEVKPYHTKILNQTEVDQIKDISNLTFEDPHTGKIVMRYGRHGDQTWQGYYIDGHPFNHLQEGWDRNPWEFDFTAEGLLPATGERVSRMKQYLWDMEQPGYEALIDTIIAGHSFGVQPEALQAIVDGNAFYQPEWDRWPEEMVALSPGESIEIRVINNASGRIVNSNTVAWRYHMDILGGTTVYRYNSAAETTVAVSADETATEIQLADASVLTRPDPVNGKPGVVWMARERIEFWEIDGNTIKRLVRGTLGTPVLAQTAGRRAYDGGQQNQVPTPSELKNWHDVLYPQWNEETLTLLNSTTREALFLKAGRGYFVPA